MSAASRFDRHQRVRLFAGPTPIQRLRRVETASGPALNGARLFVKRDDATHFGGGGSKLRKLEFLLGEVLDQGADTLIATGPRQSNSARLAAAAAASLGLRSWRASRCSVGARSSAASQCSPTPPPRTRTRSRWRAAPSPCWRALASWTWATSS